MIEINKKNTLESQPCLDSTVSTDSCFSSANSVSSASSPQSSICTDKKLFDNVSSPDTRPVLTSSSQRSCTTQPKVIGAIETPRSPLDVYYSKRLSSKEGNKKSLKSSSTEWISVYSKKRELSRATVTGYDRFECKIGFDMECREESNNSNEYNEYPFDLYLALNPNFPHQIVSFLAAPAAMSIQQEFLAAVQQVTSQHPQFNAYQQTTQSYQRYYRSKDYLKYAEKKVTCAVFYHSACKLLTAMVSNPKPRTQPSFSVAKVTEMFSVLRKFKIDGCGVVSEFFNGIDFYRENVADCVVIPDSYLTFVRWIFTGLVADPDVPEYNLDNENVSLNELINNTGLEILLTTDWQFYLHLISLIIEEIQRLIMVCDIPTLGTTNTTQNNFGKRSKIISQIISCIGSSTIFNINSVTSQLPHTEKNQKIISKIMHLMKATILMNPSVKSKLKKSNNLNESWAQAIQSFFPGYDFLNLANILKIVICTNKKFTLANMISKISASSIWMDKYRDNLFSDFMKKELRENSSQYYVEPLVKSKWVDVQ